MSRETFNKYFDLLRETLTQNTLLDKPRLIFNCDESGMPLAPKAPKVVARKGQKNLSCITSDTKSQVTVLACVNATGDCIPPFVIFNRKMKTKLAVGEVPNTYYGYSKNGWMDMELFHDWFVNHFLCYAPSERPLLLLLDGCSSHFCPDMVKLAASEQVVLFVLPPHTTQVSQPLDKESSQL